MTSPVKLTRQGVRDLGNPNPQRMKREMPRCPDHAHRWRSPATINRFQWRWKCDICPATAVTDAGENP